MATEEHTALLFTRGAWQDIADPLVAPSEAEIEAAEHDATHAMLRVNGYATTWTELGLGFATYPVQAEFGVRIYAAGATDKSPPYPFLAEVEHGVTVQRIFCADWLSLFQLLQQLTPVVNSHLLTALALQLSERSQRGKAEDG